MTKNKRFYKGTIDFLDGNGEQWAVYDKEQKRKTTTGFVDACIVDNESETCIDNMILLLNNLNDENEELRLYNREMVKDIKDLEKRNNRQAEQLDRLYKLIEEKDWKALSDIIEDFRRCDEQLRSEWGRYE